LEKLAVPFRVIDDVKAIALRSIKNQLRNTGGFHGPVMTKLRTALDTTTSSNRALKWEDPSIQNEDRFENNLNKSEILAAWERRKKRKVKKEGNEVGKRCALHVYGRQLQFRANRMKALKYSSSTSKSGPTNGIRTGKSRGSRHKGRLRHRAQRKKLAQASAPDGTRDKFRA